MPIDKTKITKEMLVKASKCKSVEELISLAKAEGFEITKDEDEAYMAEMENCEMDEKDLDKVAGGVCWSNCPTESYCAHHVCGTVGWENFKGC